MKKNKPKPKKDTWAGKSNITKVPRRNHERDKNDFFKPVKNYFFKHRKFLSEPIIATKHEKKTYKVRH